MPENIRKAGAELRRLAEAAEGVGFEMKRGKVTEAPPGEDDEGGWTGYVPLVDADDSERG